MKTISIVKIYFQSIFLSVVPFLQLLLIAYGESGNDALAATSKNINQTERKRIQNISIKNGTALSDIVNNSQFLSYTVDPKVETLQLFWKDDQGKILNTFSNLNQYLKAKNKSLRFAMNGGMFVQDYAPPGLFIEEGKIVHDLNTKHGEGNFYLLPNGVFFITTQYQGAICKTEDFRHSKAIAYATQSGPLLVVNGKMNPAFQYGSKNLNIRNGVGILPDGKVVFVLSKQPINFYDFANYFLALGCKNALYLDGSVSRAYLPEQDWIEMDGKFGVMIGVVRND
jgi:uncharacterized protein YigE (DUF2233 family)